MKINNAAPAINSPNKANNEMAFKGIPQNFKSYITKDLLKLDRKGPMPRDLFVLNAFTFLLGSRIFTARDKKIKKENKNESTLTKVRNYLRDNNEKREILIRDIPTILIAVLGVPFFSQKAATRLQKHSGFAIMDDSGKSIMNKILGKEKIGKDVISYGKIDDWYTFDKNLSKLPNGFKNFAHRLEKKGGDLKKIFSSLSDDIAKDILKLDAQNNLSSKQFIEKLFNGTEASNELLTKLKDGFKDPENQALKKAEFLKTETKLIGFGTTLLLIGLFIPKLNIYITEKINKNKKMQENAQPKTVSTSETALSKNSQTNQVFSADATKKHFREFTNK